MNKVLCIDDIPNDLLAPKQTLQDTIMSIFNGTGYKVIFKKTGTSGIKMASEDKEIKLVLLDIMFGKKAEGPSIADELQKNAPYAKIIVLTHEDERGKRISFGWKPNVVQYVIKKDLINTNTQDKVKNLSRAIIDDYTNENWHIEYPEGGAINLTHKVTGKTYGIDIPGAMDAAMKLAIASPNKPVINPGGSTQGVEYSASLSKVINTVNSKVLEGTDWNTWGILTREGCATGQLKLVVGSNAGTAVPESKSAAYISKSEFDEFKKDIELRLSNIEKKLDLD